MPPKVNKTTASLTSSTVEAKDQRNKMLEDIRRIVREVIQDEVSSLKTDIQLAIAQKHRYLTVLTVYPLPDLKTESAHAPSYVNERGNTETLTSERQASARWHQIFIFPDYSADLDKRRAAYNEVKAVFARQTSDMGSFTRHDCGSLSAVRRGFSTLPNPRWNTTLRR
ncbi:hypothetical protein F7725_021794 [Dissostichus mawsoni]|uniref:Uncharacterized protein n=1 Tax=Dissostichus mawsoni TaxID=36200 RepID=A0A7J5ZC78_DISMA|nr:hypothetical protein F7725_021794 [Dissostichus mawsoni]